MLPENLCSCLFFPIQILFIFCLERDGAELSCGLCMDGYLGSTVYMNLPCLPILSNKTCGDGCAPYSLVSENFHFFSYCKHY